MHGLMLFKNQELEEVRVINQHGLLKKEDQMIKQLIYTVLMLVLLMFVGCGESQQQDISGKEKEQKSKVAQTKKSDIPTLPYEPIPIPTYELIPIPTYEVVNRDTYDVPIKTQIELQVVVSGKITEIGLEKLLQKLYYEVNAMRGFKYHKGKPTHVCIYLYTSRNHIKSGTGQWIAALRKIGEGSEIDIQIKTELIAQFYAKPKFKHGLSESKRKEIFRAMLMAGKRAEVDAQCMYPLPDPTKPSDYLQAKATKQIEKHMQVFDSLTEKYELKVAERYGITREQLDEIFLEGLTKNWPKPSR